MPYYSTYYYTPILTLFFKFLYLLVYNKSSYVIIYQFYYFDSIVLFVFWESSAAVSPTFKIVKINTHLEAKILLATSITKPVQFHLEFVRDNTSFQLGCSIDLLRCQRRPSLHRLGQMDNSLDCHSSHSDHQT